jgi:hypothetical protein
VDTKPHHVLKPRICLVLEYGMEVWALPGTSVSNVLLKPLVDIITVSDACRMQADVWAASSSRSVHTGILSLHSCATEFFTVSKPSSGRALQGGGHPGCHAGSTLAGNVLVNPKGPDQACNKLPFSTQIPQQEEIFQFLCDVMANSVAWPKSS